MTTTAIIFIATSFFITVCGIVYLFWRVGRDVTEWERDNFDDNGYEDEKD